MRDTRRRVPHPTLRLRRRIPQCRRSMPLWGRRFRALAIGGRRGSRPGGSMHHPGGAQARATLRLSRSCTDRRRTGDPGADAPSERGARHDRWDMAPSAAFAGLTGGSAFGASPGDRRLTPDPRSCRGVRSPTRGAACAIGRRHRIDPAIHGGREPFADPDPNPVTAVSRDRSRCGCGPVGSGGGSWRGRR
jgi:hypothetical protein